MSPDPPEPPRRAGLLAIRFIWVFVAVFTIALILMGVLLATGTQT